MDPIRLKQFLDSTPAIRSPAQKISAALLKGEKLRLTEAVVSMDPLNRPLTEGFRIDTYHNKESGEDIPVLVIATHSDKLIDVFEALLDLMSRELTIVLETSHRYPNEAKHDDFYRSNAEPWFIKHIVRQYSDLFLNDSCTGIAVVDDELPEEIQFDEHKCLFVYSRRIKEFRKVLEDHGISYDKRLHLISEDKHQHVFLNEEYPRQFEELARDADVAMDSGEDEELFSS